MSDTTSTLAQAAAALPATTDLMPEMAERLKADWLAEWALDGYEPAHALMHGDEGAYGRRLGRFMSRWAVGSIRVVRTAKREGRVWTTGTPKSDASTDRVVPLAPWLADELRDYLTTVHPFGSAKRMPRAPLFPGRRNRYVFDWAKPVCAASLYEHYLQPACLALGLDKLLGGTIRFHDLRHTLRHHEPVSGRALDAGQQVARAFQLRTDVVHLRRLHPRGRDACSSGRSGNGSGNGGQRGVAAPPGQLARGCPRGRAQAFDTECGRGMDADTLLPAEQNRQLGQKGA